MIKIIIAGLLMLTISLSAGKLSNEELKNKVFCDNTETGVSIWTFDLVSSKSIQNSAGFKSDYMKGIIGDDLTWEIGQGRNMVVIDLIKIDAGEYKEDGLECYEAVRVENKKNGKVLSKEDQTLSPTIKFSLGLFGMPKGSKQDARDRKAVQAKANAEAIAANELKIQKEKEAALKAIEEKKAALEVAKAKEESKRKANAEALAEREKLQNIKSKKIKEQRKFNRNKIRKKLAVWNDFKAKHKIKNKSNLGPVFKDSKISDDVLYNLLDDMDNLLVELPFIDKDRKETIVIGDALFDRINIEWKGGYYRRAIKDINRMLTATPGFKNSGGGMRGFVFYMDDQLSTHLKKIYR